MITEGPGKQFLFYAKGERTHGRYPITSPTGKVFELPPNKHWLYSEADVRQMISDNRIWFGRSGDSIPNVKRFLTEVQQGLKSKTLWKYDEVGSNDSAKKEIKELFGDISPFDFPKPVTLIKKMLTLCNDKSNIVFDFFSGSATTALAVINFNNEHCNKLKFILVQMPEATPADSEAAKAGYTTIAEIGKERIRRVIKKIKAEKAQELSAEDEAPDLGFKVFKLARSNFKPWKDYHGDDVAAIESLFENAVTPLSSGWKNHPDALFTEILLLEGYPLDSAVKARAEFGANLIREVSCPQHEKRLLVCLDDAISPETVRALELQPDEIFVCLDSAIDDSTKARLDDKGMIKTI